MTLLSHYGLNDVPMAGLNMRLFGYVGEPGEGKAKFFKTSQIRRTSQVIMLGDAEKRQTRRGSKVMKGPFGGNKWSMINDQGWIAAVHGGRAPDNGPTAYTVAETVETAANVQGVDKSRKRYANMTFFDGHVESVPFSVLLEQRDDLWGRQTR
jgi:prepilin-type processing-associated H-X9-DG protein